jgi:hypothetical protein
MEGNIFEGTVPSSAWKDGGEPLNPTVTLANFWTEIRTRDLWAVRSADPRRKDSGQMSEEFNVSLLILNRKRRGPNQ